MEPFAIKKNYKLETNLPFLRPRYTGKRFHDQTMPVEMLEDLAVYERLLLELAKEVYYQQTGQRRVPKGFGKGVSLKLSGEIEEGSSILNLVIAAATSFFVGTTDTRPFYEEAQSRIVRAIDAADNNQNVNAYLPPEFCQYFNQIGKRLRDDEAIHFQVSGQPNLSGTLTRDNRRKLAKSSPNKQLESEAHVRGFIGAYDKVNTSFTIHTDDGAKIVAKLDKQYKRIVDEAFNQYEDNCRVLVSGIAVFNKNDKIETFNTIDSITILDKLDVPTRLQEFLNYPSGWYDGEGEAYNTSDIAWLSDKFDVVYDDINILLPYTFPTPDGGVQFEWKRGHDDATLMLDLKTRIGYYHYYNDSTEAEEEFDLDLSDEDVWENLNLLLLNHFKISDS